MTELEWTTCYGPHELLAYLSGRRLFDRKLRLWACACARRVWDLLTDERSLKAIEWAEQRADDLTKDEETPRALVEVEEVEETLRSATPDGSSARFWYAARAARDAFAADFYGAAWCSAGATHPTMNCFDAECYEDGMGARGFDPFGNLPERGVQAALLHDIFGPLPFRPVTLDPAWLSPPVPELALSIYQERELPSGHLNNERLAVLADVLEENGCDNQEVLGHLRRPEAVHVRGCWCVDLVLNK